MAIVTKPSSFTKGDPAVYTLDKAELALLPEVSGDGYFSDDSNWRSVSALMKSTVGGQTKALVFDALLGSPTADFLATLTARDDFEVDRLTIFDFDGGTLDIPRSALPTAEFDISVAGPVILDQSPNIIHNLSGNMVNPLQWQGQVITASQTGTISTVDIAIKHTSGSSITGTWTMHIYTVDGSGDPDTLVQSSTPLDPNTFPTVNPLNVLFTFPVGAPTTVGVEYAWVLDTSGATFNGDQFQMFGDNTAGTSTNYAVKSTDGGSSWTHIGSETDTYYYTVSGTI